jgi:hypothetical protein
MKASFFNGLNRARIAASAMFTALCRKLSVGVEKIIPLGHEDEDGFHVDGGE